MDVPPLHHASPATLEFLLRQSFRCGKSHVKNASQLDANAHWCEPRREQLNLHNASARAFLLTLVCDHLAKGAETWLRSHNYLPELKVHRV